MDATVGGGGHAAAILDAHAHLRVMGIDRDPDAVSAAPGALSGSDRERRCITSRFDKLLEVRSEGVPEARAFRSAVRPRHEFVPARPRTRGVSHCAVTDPWTCGWIRPTRHHPTAADLVNNLPVARADPDVRRQRRAQDRPPPGQEVVAGRPLSTTGQLADVIAAATPAALRRRGHPATRVFQSLRIAVNDELEQLAEVLPDAISALAPRAGA